MSNYAWVIDKDYLPDESLPEGSYGNAKSVIGPRDAPQELIGRLATGDGYRFRMFDDDGELYYAGRLVLQPDIDPGNVYHTYHDMHGWACASLPEEAFGPLWDFGQGNAGCTSIHYRDNNGRYGVL